MPHFVVTQWILRPGPFDWELVQILRARGADLLHEVEDGHAIGDEA